MVELKLYDSLSRSVRVFEPLSDRPVGIYSCGPTVYARQHLGNMRPYVFADLLRRTLSAAGYAVKHVINITDVGHLTSDADEGADKVELAASRAQTSAHAITELYTALFQTDLQRLSVLAPHVWAKASAHIPEQIAMIERLEARGFSYLTSDRRVLRRQSRAPLRRTVGSASERRPQPRGEPERQASARRLRALEVLGQRRTAPAAGVAEPVGRRLSGLAHRVQRDGQQIPR